MANPPLVDVWRDGLVESIHRGAYAVMDGRGAVVASAGDIDKPVFPRSAYKTFQALPLVESGAADSFDLNLNELAITCASHLGARVHADTVEAWLKRIRVRPRALECGAQVPRDDAERDRLARRRQRPSALHNNCSGKHAGFISLAVHLGHPVEGYIAPDHPVQEQVSKVIAEICEVDLAAMPVAIDGCSAPNLGMSLRQFGRGVARCAAMEDLPAHRAEALSRLFAAQAARPMMVAGNGALDTGLIAAGGGALITKVGAEGVYSGFVLERKLGVVVKIDDGAIRAAESVICEILVRLGVIDPGLPAIQAYHRPVLLSFRGLHAGRLQPRDEAFADIPG